MAKNYKKSRKPKSASVASTTFAVKGDEKKDENAEEEEEIGDGVVPFTEDNDDDDEDEDGFDDSVTLGEADAVELDEWLSAATSDDEERQERTRADVGQVKTRQSKDLFLKKLFPR